MIDDLPATTRAANVCVCLRRRDLLAGAAAVALGNLLPSAATLAADPDPAKLPPAIGDGLAFASWDNDGRLVTAADLVLDAAPVVVYPRDPTSGITREKSRLNQILLLRLDPSTLNDTARVRAVDGVIAYSAICTHAACGVTEWNATSRHVICPCHSSEYDPAQGAVRVNGPAPRPLPALALKRDGETFTIAAAFSAAVGGNAQ